MQEELEKQRAACISLCERLLSAMENNREDADLFCNGEIHKTYVSVNDKVAGQIRNIRTKIRNL